jgi:hypothetical protein
MSFINKVQSETDINCRKKIYILQDSPTVFMLQTIYSGSAHKRNRGQENMTPDMTGSSQ